jgi:hypothetical protein
MALSRPTHPRVTQSVGRLLQNNKENFMSKEDDLLANELGKIGSIGGKFGESITGSKIAGIAAGIGGFVGANVAARFLPTERHQFQININADPKMILAKVYSFFLGKGEVIDSDEIRKSPYPTVSGKIGSGALNMNPAIVHAEIISIQGETCTILITGAAKEGLIKQHTAEKAVNRLADALKNMPT